MTKQHAAYRRTETNRGRTATASVNELQKERTKKVEMGRKTQHALMRTEKRKEKQTHNRIETEKENQNN